MMTGEVRITAWRSAAGPLVRQRGIIVIVALIVMVAMSLAAVGLIRSVDTTTLVVGNIAFRQASAAISSAAIEKALHQISPPTRVIDPRNHDLGRNYYAFWQDTDDAHGVPQALRGDISESYPGTFQVLEDNVGNKARYVIERMCLPPALGKDPSADVCEMILPKQNLGMTANKQFGIALPKIPYYRLTVRVDGPGANNAVSYSQAMLR